MSVRTVLLTVLSLGLALASLYAHREQYLQAQELAAQLEDAREQFATAAQQGMKYVLDGAQVTLGKDPVTGNIVVLLNGIPWRRFHGVCRPEKAL